MRRSRAVFTLVRNENVWLPIWARYYARYFEPQDIYVIDHESSDGSVEAARAEVPFQVLTVHYPRLFDPLHQIEVVATFDHQLQDTHELVVFSDADELVVADPERYSGLDDYLERAVRADVYACNSRSVLQLRSEPPLDLEAPLLGQRSTWFSECLYNKPAVARVPFRRGYGMHGAYDPLGNGDPVPVFGDPDLVLLHLARADYSIRHERAQALEVELGATLDEKLERWGAAPGFNVQWLLSEDLFDDWFYYVGEQHEIQSAPEGTLTYEVSREDHGLVERIPPRFQTVV